MALSACRNDSLDERQVVFEGSTTDALVCSVDALAWSSRPRAPNGIPKANTHTAPATPVWVVLPEKTGDVSSSECAVTEAWWSGGVCNIQVTMGMASSCPNSTTECVRRHENVHVEQDKAICEQCAGYTTDTLRQACMNCVASSYAHTLETSAYDTGCSCELAMAPPGPGRDSDQCGNWADQCVGAKSEPPATRPFACVLLATTAAAIMGNRAPTRSGYCDCESVPRNQAYGCSNFDCYGAADCVPNTGTLNCVCYGC